MPIYAIMKYMDELDFEFYTRPNGHTEFKEYLDSLDVKSKAKLLARINIVAKKGIGLSLLIRIYMKFVLESVVINNVDYIFMLTEPIM